MKLVRFVAVGLIAVAALRAIRTRMSSLCGSMFDAMPDDSPPKKMASDLAAIRSQNDRILEMLERHPTE